jgi:aspartate/methionine/tyrosine aminotransferase
MKEPLNFNLVSKLIEESGITDFGTASIYEIATLVSQLENATGMDFIRMEMGVPGLQSNKLAVEAEIESIQQGVTSKYPPMAGIPKLKNEASTFIKNFLNIDVSSAPCIPTVGSTQGSFAVMMVACKREVNKDALLFLDPGFPIQKQQIKILGHKYYGFDVYGYRGDLLKDKIESYLAKGDIGTILYSNPNNPAWICFTEKELQIIADLANKYDVVVVEDLAYFAMDFRVDLSKPGKAPYQPSIANYTDNYILLVSSSKVFSYAGQRIALIVVSDYLFTKKFPLLKNSYTTDTFGQALIFGALAALSSGAPHSAQYALYSILHNVNNEKYKFLDELKEYEKRAILLKELFADFGFRIVYNNDANGKSIADGFYFTVSYPGLNGVSLVEKLLYYGISLIPLNITGSSRLEGTRVCVSIVKPEQLPKMKERLALFVNDNPISIN